MMIAPTTDKPLISIVDDDESVRRAVTRLMRSVGFDGRAFASAEEFLSSPELSETSCLISDVQMPGINGLELQSRLAAEQPRTPIIMITAFPDAHVKEAALKAGAVCFLQKPFDGKALVECVGRVVNRLNS